MRRITGYSLYVNQTYYETYKSLKEVYSKAKLYRAFNDIDVLPMWKFY